ncbi:dihydrolipoyllysine acetyltransferase [Natronococcus pandeyae]|uniref:Dihydrolipoyllysine acetyltransferase n=1 Tax=Natronococcus pandeyae TaxID=2055836 RepID=A0A8J8Q822_9EURY|nr:2-oxo acid dehydrogenase subunit E2 [Natronococcus pandeyae]TYL40498.1 dihydrolipoyllysine acetyltransferase [Natronococcus pandeyae]
MGYVVRMPKLGLEMERGELLEWTIDEGATIEDGEVVAEVESEKSVAEVEARENGTLRRTYLEEGESVPPGTPIGIVAPADADIGDLESEVAAELDATDEPTPDASDSATDDGTGAADDAAVAEHESETGSRAAAADRKISPRARKRAAELGVDLATVEGTGYDGAITEDDVEEAADSDASERREADVDASPRARKRAEELGVDLTTVDGTGYQGSITESDVEETAESADDAGRALVEERPFDGMRRTIASRLGESYREAVHVTVHREADAEGLFAAADAADADLEADVSVQDVLLLAVSAALEEHPAFNATFEDDVHRLWAEHNVGVAVDIEQGLIAPVLRDVGGKSLEAIATERRALVRSATEGEYAMGDLQGGTFTVTNLGVLGVESFDPIINPPQVAILGVDAVEEAPVRGANDEVEWRRRLPLDLSFDHRVVDGADAARFLETLVETLEDPWPLLPDEVSREAGEEAKGADTEMPDRTVTAHNPDGMAGTIEAGSFEWSFDEPEEAGGSETGPTPVDVFLGALASCLSLSVRFQADKRDAPVGAIDVTTDADPGHGSVERVEATVRLETDADDETVERIVDLGERGCHVSQLLREDLPVEISWTRT